METIVFLIWIVAREFAGWPGLLGISGTMGFRGGKTETHAVLWAEEHDFAVVLAKRMTQDGPKYYLLKTAYCLKPHRIATFTKEGNAFWAARND